MKTSDDDLPVVQTHARKPSPAKPQRRWLRFFYQFSLRTLLILTTLAAVGCWWFLRPETKEEDLFGKYLTLRRQIKLVDTPPESRNIVAMNGSIAPAFADVNVGTWELRGPQGELLVAGRYAQGEQSGRWTIWHATGRKAVEGKIIQGARGGLWQEWDAQGALRSEVTYRAVKRKQETKFGRPAAVTFLPIVGNTGPLAQFGGGFGGMGGGFSPRQFPVLPPYVSERHGPFRVWYASGQLHYQGQYAADRRDGVWTWYDERGKTVAQENFGSALVAGTKPGPGALGATSVSGIPGPGSLPATSDELPRLERELASGNLRRQVAAAAALEALGPSARPIFNKLLASKSADAKFLALRGLVRQAAVPPEMLPQIEPLADHSDQRLALLALSALRSLEPARRTRHFERLAALVADTEHESLAIEMLQRFCTDPERRDAALLRLIEIQAQYCEPPDGGALFGPIRDHLRPILAVEGDMLPVLTQALQSPDAKVRLIVLQLVEALIEQEQPSARPTGETYWAIPAAFQPLVDRGLADGDPLVREQAEEIGKVNSYLQGGGFFGGSGMPGQGGMGGQVGGFFE